MSDTKVSVIGNVASDVQSKDTPTGVLTSFRLASQRRYYNRRLGRWVDEDVAFYRVVCWRGLAENVRDCLRKGEPIVVQGRLKFRDWTDEQGHKRTDAEVDAFTVAYDLKRGTAVFTRTKRQVEAADDEDELLDHIRSEQRANAGNEVIVDPRTGEVFNVDTLQSERPEQSAGRATDSSPEPSTDQPSGPAAGASRGREKSGVAG